MYRVDFENDPLEFFTASGWVRFCCQSPVKIAKNVVYGSFFRIFVICHIHKSGLNPAISLGVSDDYTNIRFTMGPSKGTRPRTTTFSNFSYPTAATRLGVPVHMLTASHSLSHCSVLSYYYAEQYFSDLFSRLKLYLHYFECSVARVVLL